MLAEDDEEEEEGSGGGGISSALLLPLDSWMRLSRRVSMGRTGAAGTAAAAAPVEREMDVTDWVRRWLCRGEGGTEQDVDGRGDRAARGVITASSSDCDARDKLVLG